MIDVIDSFSGEYRFLSNFYPCAVDFEGVSFPTTEHAYQAAKTRNRFHRISLAGVPTAGGVKRAGRLVDIRPDWEEIKYETMKRILRLKFYKPQFAEKLLATEEALLIEGNTWGDTVWGVCNGKGTNWLGKILMEIRDEVRLE